MNVGLCYDRYEEKAQKVSLSTYECPNLPVICSSLLRMSQIPEPAFQERCAPLDLVSTVCSLNGALCELLSVNAEICEI